MKVSCTLLYLDDFERLSSRQKQAVERVITLLRLGSSLADCEIKPFTDECQQCILTKHGLSIIYGEAPKELILIRVAKPSAFYL